MSEGRQHTSVPRLSRRSRKITTIPPRRGHPTSCGPDASGPADTADLGTAGSGKGCRTGHRRDGIPCTNYPVRPGTSSPVQTHPKVLAADGKKYRTARIEQARNSGVADAVSFDAAYRTPASSMRWPSPRPPQWCCPTTPPIRFFSGVLVDAIASGRPVVATAFPHAAGCSPAAPESSSTMTTAALVVALRRILTEPNLAGSMAAEARRLAPTMAWPVVARQYLRLAQRLASERPALT